MHAQGSQEGTRAARPPGQMNSRLVPTGTVTGAYILLNNRQKLTSLALEAYGQIGFYRDGNLSAGRNLHAAHPRVDGQSQGTFSATATGSDV